MISKLITRPCTITRRLPSETRDRYNRRVPVAETVETVCDIQQQRRDEPDLHAELSDTLWHGYFLPAERLHTGDKVAVGGETFEVHGDPWRVWDPWSGCDSHLEATLRRTAGAAEEVGS